MRPEMPEQVRIQIEECVSKLHPMLKILITEDPIKFQKMYTWNNMAYTGDDYRRRVREFTIWHDNYMMSLIGLNISFEENPNIGRIVCPAIEHFLANRDTTPEKKRQYQRARRSLIQYAKSTNMFMGDEMIKHLTVEEMMLLSSTVTGNYITSVVLPDVVASYVKAKKDIPGKLLYIISSPTEKHFKEMQAEASRHAGRHVTRKEMFKFFGRKYIEFVANMRAMMILDKLGLRGLPEGLSPITAVTLLKAMPPELLQALGIIPSTTDEMIPEDMKDIVKGVDMPGAHYLDDKNPNGYVRDIHIDEESAYDLAAGSDFVRVVRL